MEKEILLQTKIEERDMSIILKDGSKCLVKGKVIEKHYKSGRIDTKISIDRPLGLQGKAEEIRRK